MSVLNTDYINHSTLECMKYIIYCDLSTFIESLINSEILYFLLLAFHEE